MSQEKSVGKLISCIHRYTHIHMHKKMETYGIGSGQLFFLTRLYRHEGINQETLAEILSVDKATCARAIKKLEEQGFVIRKRDETDKRSYQILLTDKAKKLKPQIKQTLQEWTRNLLKGFTKKEQQQLFNYLERIEHNASLYK